MINLERNKIIASILLSLLIIMLVSFFANLIYRPKYNKYERGYIVKIANDENSTNNNDKENIKKKKFNIEGVKKLLASASFDRGKKLAKKCISCHSFEKDGKNKIGPNLWNIFMSKIARKDFIYSKAFLLLKTSKEKEEFIWDEDNLAQFLHKPKEFIKSTKMNFIGLKKEEDVANIIAYLKELK